MAEEGGVPATGGERDAFDAELLSKITGVRQAVGGHRPFLIEDTEKVWLVLRGHIDVYAMEMQGDAPANTGRHVMRVGAGAVLFGVESLPLPDHPFADRLALRAVAAMGTELYEGRAADVQGEDFDIIVVDWIDRWVAYLSQAMVKGAAPRNTQVLEAEPEMSFSADTDVCAQFEDTVWARLDSGRATFLSEPAFERGPEDSFIPITEWTWLSLETDSVLSCAYTPTLLFTDELWPALARFHGVFMPRIWSQIQARKVQESRRQTRKWAESQGRFDQALRSLASVLHPDIETADARVRPDGTGALFAAFRTVMASQGVEAVEPRSGLDRKGVDPLREFARATKVRMRKVTMAPDWHRKDNGPLLGYYGDGEAPVALLPRTKGRGYDMLDPASGQRVPVTTEVSNQLGYHGYMFYIPFPTRPLDVPDVLRFGIEGLGKELRMILYMGLLAGGLGMLVPIFTGYLFGSVVPRADLNTHFSIIGALVMAAFGVFVFEVTRGFSLLRVQGKMDGKIQSAVWDRLLGLPMSFFRAYTAGDLADRANSINAIREVLTGATMQTVFSALFSVFSFALLFYYSWELALVAFGLVLFAIAMTVLFTWLMMPHKQAELEVLGKVEGLVFQFLAGIGKLRASNSEPRAFAQWAEKYRDGKYHKLQAATLNAGQEVFNSMFPVIASITIFAYVYYQFQAVEEGAPSFSVGDFLSFNSALGQFNAAMMALTAAVSQIVEIVPLYRRADPILKAVPEVKSDAIDPGELYGHIELSNVTFRYLPEGPPILDDINLTIRPGEYVAFVGSSGSGKSTILRLLLGFEQPEAGGVYYDGQDLSGLDIGAVRRQIGVVLQSSRLTSGSIFENIVGSSKLTQDDAWEAARAAGMENDIKDLPMGMHTMLSEGAATLSGGQKQRLMIARALVQRPRILMLDEATSALDNHTQAVVNASLDKQNLTRVVVAHRLSTIINAHRIIVLKHGQIVESGRYSDLMARDGEFAALARRQLL